MKSFRGIHMKGLCGLLAVAMVLSTAGCLEDASREEKTALGGALVGAAVGGLIGSKGANAGKGMLIGAAIGGAGGFLVGKMTKPKEGVAATVVCPHCETMNQLPTKAKANDIIQCHNCGKQFKLQ